MATEWYIAKDGKRVGPLSNKAIRELAETGTLTPSDLVWKEGLREWIPASRIAKLFPTQSQSLAPATNAGNVQSIVGDCLPKGEHAWPWPSEQKMSPPVQWVPAKAKDENAFTNDDFDFDISPLDKKAGILSFSKMTAIVALMGAISGTFVSGVVGIALSQYWPVFGGFIERSLAVPWSPARISLIPLHLFVFSITGFVLGCIAGGSLGALFSSLRISDSAISVGNRRQRVIDDAFVEGVTSNSGMESRNDSPPASRDKASRGNGVKEGNRLLKWSAILAILGATFAVVVIGGVGVLRFVSTNSHNAKCLGCGTEFHIPESHRGTIAEMTRMYRCPNCDIEWYARQLYDRMDREKKWRQMTPEEQDATRKKTEERKLNQARFVQAAKAKEEQRLKEQRDARQREDAKRRKWAEEHGGNRVPPIFQPKPREP